MWCCSERYMHYEISDEGCVRDTIFGNVVKPKVNRQGYLTVYLPYASHNYRKRNGECSHTYTLHTVVAHVFLPPPN